MVILIDCNINEGCSKVILLGSNGKVIVSGMGIIALPMEGGGLWEGADGENLINFHSFITALRVFSLIGQGAPYLIRVSRATIANSTADDSISGA